MERLEGKMAVMIGRTHRIGFRQLGMRGKI